MMKAICNAITRLVKVGRAVKADSGPVKNHLRGPQKGRTGKKFLHEICIDMKYIQINISYQVY